MEETGIVIEIKDGRAVVKMTASGGCEGCGASGSCKAVSGGRVLEADNAIGAKPGQHVVMRIEPSVFLKASFIVYMVPIIFLFLGAWLGGKVGPGLYPGMSIDYWQALSGALFLGLSIFVIRLYDKGLKKGKMLMPVIIRIVEGNALGGENEKVC